MIAWSYVQAAAIPPSAAAGGNTGEVTGAAVLSPMRSAAASEEPPLPSAGESAHDAAPGDGTAAQPGVAASAPPADSPIDDGALVGEPPAMRCACL